MKKYPVISKNGNKYEVKIFVGQTISYAGLNIIIYKRRKGFFGLFKRKNLKHFSVLNYRDFLDEWEYSYVTITKHFVKKYEKELLKEVTTQNKCAKGIKEFEEWDGIIE